MAYDLPYPIPPEQAIASYDYADLAERTGVKLFYAGYNSNASQTALLSSNQFYSGKIESAATTKLAVPTKVLDINFDLTAFNAPQSIRGTAIINYCSRTMAVGATGVPTFSSYVIVKIRKGDGTEIANVQSATSSTTASTKSIACLTVPITLTPFKREEILRVTIEGWAWCSVAEGANEVRLIIGHDPMNRDGTYIIPSTDTAPSSTTQLKAWIPFNLDL